MCSFAESNRPKLDICIKLQKKHRIGKHIILVVMELLYNAHHIRELYFRELQIWK